MRTSPLHPRKKPWTDTSILCFGTSVMTVAAAGIGYAVDKFITPWPMTTLMVVVSAFFFAQGVLHLVGQALQKPRPAVDVDEAHALAGRQHAFDDASEIGRSEFHREAAALEAGDRDQQCVQV